MHRFVLAAAFVAGSLALGFADDAADKALKELEGTYTVKSLEKDGKPAPDEVAKSFESVAIKDGKLLLKIGGEEKSASLKLDPSKTPAHLDLSPLDGPEKGNTFPGLYKFEKGELTIVMVEKGDRPKELTSEGKDVMKLVFTKK
jgi:uncharacterized protein (TIGR03067 family)